MKGTWINWIMLVILSLVWGSSFYLIKKGLTVYSPEQVAMMRIFFSFIALSPLFIKHVPKLRKDRLWALLIVAVLGSGIPPFLFSLAQTKIDSSLTGILNSLTPLFTLVIGYLLFASRFGVLKMIGVVIGFIGAVNLIIFRADGNFESNYLYALLVVLASACYGVGANVLKEKLQDVAPTTIAVLVFFIIGPVAGFFLLGHTDFIYRTLHVEGAGNALIHVILLGSVGTGYAVILFNHLIQNTDALFASMVTYLIPIVAVFWGVFDGEQIGYIHIIGMTLILLGIYLSSIKKPVGV